jgi:hypothetical protein
MDRFTRITRGARIAALLILTSSLASAYQGGDIYVDDDSSLGNSGTSWADSYKYLRDALAVSGVDDVIHIARGTYLPDHSETVPGDMGNPLVQFHVERSGELRGGYAGITGANPDERNTDVYLTILSGDLQQNDGGLLDPSSVDESDPLRADNSALVVYIASDAVLDVILDGLVIQDGFNAAGVAGVGGFGAGCLYYGSSGSNLEMVDCVVRGNFAGIAGAGMLHANRGTLAFTDCEFVGNVSRVGGAYACGGAVVMYATRCVFQQNHLIAADDTDLCLGAALCLRPIEGQAVAFIDDCVFQGNSSNTGFGAGKGVVYAGPNHLAVIQSCTFKDNQAESGRGGATLYCDTGTLGVLFANNLCWDASPVGNHMIYPQESAGTSVAYCDLEDLAGNAPPPAMDAGGNFEGEPDFLDEYGRLGEDSLCIDAGMNLIAILSTVDFDLQDRILDDPFSSASGLGGPADGTTPGTPGLRPIIDVGAFEYFSDCNGNDIHDSDDVISGYSEDCNGNGLPDECETLEDCNGDLVPDECQTLDDCDGNGTPDECEDITDCNGNMIPDSCDIADMTSDDCDLDGVPDECDPIDCNGNMIPDSCDIADMTSDDCNLDGVPDECDMIDCNGNLVLDECDIAAATSHDCQPDGIPDECQDDCNDNGIDDSCDIADMTSTDCNSNGEPDECEDLDDCNKDGVPDICVVMEDCNADGTPDVCQSLEDCDMNGTPDECEFHLDCQPNGVPDICEVFDDCDGNSVPDECQPDCDGDDLPDVCEADCQPNGIPDDCEPLTDCNGNSIPDDCDLAAMTSEDCDGNLVPDECDPDCDGDGAPDVCELADMTAEDCDENGYPDNCQPDCDADGVIDPCEEDCDKNGVPDDCETLEDCNMDGTPDVCQDLEDCNKDGTPDECQILADCQPNGIPDACEMWPDCNGNDVPDSCDIDSGFSLDCNFNMQPDECDPDCDRDGIPDDCEIDAGSEDCDMNGVPDECEPDCNMNGVADFCDIRDGFSEDCDEDGVPDECQPDCNMNGIADPCDILSGFSEDCNANIIPDECEFPEGDLNLDGVLDDCELACVEFNRYEDLTPGDTFTAITRTHNPQQEAGYIFVNAADRAGEPVGYNGLIGSLLIVDGIDNFDYQMNAVSFPSPIRAGSLTDLDGDGNLDLNGEEYAMAPNEILIPRFFGQGGPAGMTESKLLLIGLSGGSEFDTNVEFIAANDNEELFSADFSFRCWAKVKLERVSSLFNHDFLSDFTAHDPGEVLGAPHIETGWFRMRGRVANSVAATVSDPAIYGVLIENGGGVSVADLPFEMGSRAGSLLPHAVMGDNQEAGGANFVDPDAAVHRRVPGSLLLYPEFDNRDGVFSVMTVTNVGSETVRGHIVYVGRYQQL